MALHSCTLFERTSRWLRVGMRARDDGQALSHEIFGDVGGVFLGRHRDGRERLRLQLRGRRACAVTHRRAPGVFIVSRMNFKHRGSEFNRSSRLTLAFFTGTCRNVEGATRAASRGFADV